MEHRWNVRTPVQAQAIVYHPRFGSRIGTVCDASASGAFIALCAVERPRNATVSLSLPFVDARGAELLHLGALVVRADDSGLGVMLLIQDEATCRAVQRWIQASRPRPRTVMPTARVIPFPVRPAVWHVEARAPRRPR